MFEHELLQLEHEHLRRRLLRVDSAQGPWVTVGGRKVLLMCSNDYLGLASHPKLKEAACAAMEQYGFGSGASRLVSGNSALHEELENRLAAFKGTESAIVFNSGYAANTGIIPAVAGETDAVFSDSLNHASIIDGCRLSRASVHVFRHKDADHLESLLRKSDVARRRLIVTDGVFSMDGDIAPLPDLVSLAGKYGAMVMVDDAHAAGVLGKNGRGTAEHFGLQGRVHIQMGTLGKAFGSFGAYAAGDRSLIEYLANTSRSFLFSTALPPAVCAASIAALSIVESLPELMMKLRKNRSRLVDGLKALGISTGRSETPIIPVIIGDNDKALKVSARILDEGLFAPAIRPPTVPAGTARIRTTITAAHSDNDIDRALEIFGILKKEGFFSNERTE
jgi:8-amino-7-oxononanoate synthase